APGVPYLVTDVHQAQEDTPCGGLLLRRKLRERRIRRLRDGTLDAATGQVVRDRQPAAVTALPRGQQGVGEQRQRPGVVRHSAVNACRRRQIADDDLDQAVVDGDAQLPR